MIPHAVNFVSILRKDSSSQKLDSTFFQRLTFLPIMRALFWWKWVKNRKFFAIISGAQKNEYILAFCVKLKWEGATKSARGGGGDIVLIRWACLLDRLVGPLDASVSNHLSSAK